VGQAWSWKRMEGVSDWVLEGLGQWSSIAVPGCIDCLYVKHGMTIPVSRPCEIDLERGGTGLCMRSRAQ
jgi:hypothetical protein